ncbi:MAG: NAD kinase [Bacteroidetes bacterium]|nr:MAG: NAD kinase [Bacteroidota bacterium]
MKLAIFGRISDNTDFKVLEQFFHFLEKEQIAYTLYERYAEQLLEHVNCLQSSKIAVFNEQQGLLDAKFVYCFGGDGTVLEAVRFVGRLGKPILGVNFGRMGYLSSISQAELIPATLDLKRDLYKIDTRSMLSVVSDPPGVFSDANYGINDLTIHKSNTNEMITVHAYVNGEYLNTYWGDGLIVATPTGSTAYSLSCGGPIIFPHSATFSITPVAPHSLTVRPVVIPDNWVVSFEIESRSGEVMIALDNRTELVKARTSLAVRKADFKIKLLRMSTTKHIDNLRRSLMWGHDRRNRHRKR